MVYVHALIGSTKDEGDQDEVAGGAYGMSDLGEFPD